MVDADDRRALGTRVTLLAIAAMTAAGGVASAAPEPEPLEVLAVDTTAFPHVVVDVAVPERERASEMPSEAFSLPGLTDVTVEELDPADLTLAIVLDDGPEVRTPGLAFQQGAAAELVRILPADVEVMIRTSSGVEMEPTVDRDAAMDAIGSTRPGSTSGTLAAAAGDAVQRLETVPDGRRQLVVMTGEASDIQEEEATSLLASLDRAGRRDARGVDGRHRRPAARPGSPRKWRRCRACRLGRRRRAAGRRRPQYDVRRAVPVAGHDAGPWARHRPPDCGRPLVRGDDSRRRRDSDDHLDAIHDVHDVGGGCGRDDPSNRGGPADDGPWRAGELR